MLLSREKKFIFLKTYKTASTSIEFLLRDYCGTVPESFYKKSEDVLPSIVSDRGIITHSHSLTKLVEQHRDYFWDHITAEELKSKLDEHTWRNYFKFCVVRNPYEKFFSLLVFSVVQTFGKFSIKRAQELMQYIMQRNARINWFDSNVYLMDEKPCVDAVIRYENLREDLNKVLAVLDIPFREENFPRINSEYMQKNFDIKLFYTDEMIQFIKQKYWFEIETFGYEDPR